MLLGPTIRFLNQPVENCGRVLREERFEGELALAHSETQIELAPGSHQVCARQNSAKSHGRQDGLEELFSPAATRINQPGRFAQMKREAFLRADRYSFAHQRPQQHPTPSRIESGSGAGELSEINGQPAEK